MSDIVRRLLDHENEGITSSDRFRLREEAAETIAAAQTEIAALKHDIDKSVAHNAELHGEIAALREALGKINTMACFASEEDTSARAAALLLLEIGKAARAAIDAARKA